MYQVKILIFILCISIDISKQIETRKESEPHLTTEVEESDDKAIEKEEANRTKSFVDKFRELHHKNRNKSVSYSVKHINETFEAIDNFRENFKYLFKTDDRLSNELLEFLFELDIQLSTTCSSALFNIYLAIKESEIWAMRCEFK